MGESVAVERDLGVGEFRWLILEHIQMLLRTMSEREELNSTNDFVKPEPTPLRRRYSSDELHREVRALATAIGLHYPQTAVIADQTMKPADRAVSVQTCAELLRIFNDIGDVHRQGGGWGARGGDVFAMRTNGDRVYISASDLGDDSEGALATVVASTSPTRCSSSRSRICCQGGGASVVD